MYLKHLSIVNFKNYIQAEFDFSQKINCFVGNNGTGKTNILDAIHYLCMCKSYFNPIDSQNIRTGCDFSVIQGMFMSNDKQEDIYCAIQRMHSKVFKRNKKEYNRLSDHIGLIPVVVISPADENLITEGSDERRKFMNSVIAQYDKQYLEDNIRYNHILMQRNKMLKDTNIQQKFDEETLTAYDEQLIPIGERIYTKRMEFTSNLIPIFKKYYNFISSSKESVDFTYHSQLNEGSFSDLLKSARSKDRILQYSTFGIHKDDLILTLDGMPIKRIGSQGQQKTYLVALKLAQFDFIKKVNGTLPVFLFDDIFDKFDENRVKQIIHLFSDNHFGQIFMTHTDPGRIKEFMHQIGAEFRLFFIDNGNIVSAESSNK
jgi:DNA replication and repair protein RecF